MIVELKCIQFREIKERECTIGPPSLPWSSSGIMISYTMPLYFSWLKLKSFHIYFFVIVNGIEKWKKHKDSQYWFSNGLFFQREIKLETFFHFILEWKVLPLVGSVWCTRWTFSHSRIWNVLNSCSPCVLHSNIDTHTHTHTHT